MEATASSTEHAEGSRESSAESTNASPKEVPPKDSALLESEVAALSKALTAVSNEAARIVTRQHWRKCLIGTEKDQSFLVRAVLKHSTPHVYARAIEDYGEKFLEVADDDFLDRALELRLSSIDADKLVALLAKAKRLGYDEQDVVDEEEDVTPVQSGPPQASEPVAAKISNPEHREAIMVDRPDLQLAEQSRNAIAPPRFVASPYQTIIPAGSYAQNMNLPTRRKAKDPTSRKFVCPDCMASFAQQGGLTYHMERKVCHRPAPQFRWFCKTCGKGFTTSGGKLYHEQNRVCEAHEIANATPPISQIQPGPVPIKPMPSAHLRDALPPPSNGDRPNSAHAPPMAGPPYQQPPYHTHYNPSHGISLSTHNPSTHTPPPWPSKRVEPQSQSTTPSYPELRANITPPYQTTPVRASPGSESAHSDSQVLDPATQAELNARIAAEVARFEKKCREIPDTLSAADREEALTKEKRGHATRKSQIRKKYGIQIRTSKLQPANFVRVPSQGDAPNLAPISRIAAFRAPSDNTTQPVAISASSSIERSRQRPIMEDPDPKRRRLEESPSFQQENRPDPDGAPSGLQRSMSAQSPEALDINSANKPEPAIAAEPQTGSTKVPKKVQWETLPPETSPLNQPTALEDISNKALRPKSPRDGKSNTELVAHTSEDGSNSGDEDSDVDPDEDIPARLPIGAIPRRTRSSTGTASSSASPAPTSAVKRTGSSLFSSASSSRRSSESGPAAERRTSLGSARIRAVVQV